MDLNTVQKLSDLGLITNACRLNFQETMTFIFAIAFIIYSVSHFFRTLNEPTIKKYVYKNFPLKVAKKHETKKN